MQCPLRVPWVNGLATSSTVPLFLDSLSILHHSVIVQEPVIVDQSISPLEDIASRLPLMSSVSVLTASAFVHVYLKTYNKSISLHTLHNFSLSVHVFCKLL